MNRGNGWTGVKRHRANCRITGPIAELPGQNRANREVFDLLIALRASDTHLTTDGYELQGEVPPELVSGVKKHRGILIAALRAIAEPACDIALRQLLDWANDDTQKVVTRSIAKIGQQLGLPLGKLEWPWQYAARIRTVCGAQAVLAAWQVLR